MKIWNQAPLIRLLLPFLAGIFGAVYFPCVNGSLLFVVAGIFVFVAAVVLVNKFNISYRRSVWFGMVVNIFLILISYQLTIFHTAKYSHHHFSKILNSGDLLLARLTTPYTEKERSLKAILEIIAVRKADHWIEASGKVLVYIKTDSLALSLNYGDELLLKADLKEIKAPQNPAAFDYKKFLSFHNIYHQTYLKQNAWKKTGGNSGAFLMKESIRLRSHLLNLLEENDLRGDELSVGAALLLGYTDKLDPELMTAYSSTGALHVLSVSGLHVAIVYVVFSWFLFFLDRNTYTRILKALCLLLFLWFYAALTGLSPSVLRAATMFSFIIIAKATNRHTNIYNTLAASAFFLLLIDPFLVMEVGFQLSYLAVIGIVYLQPKIYGWLEFDNWLADQSWNVTAVSIAAQIATFPLGLYCFHQFPNYFLLSNLVVIPLSTIIIYVGIALFVLSKFTLLAKCLSLIFGWLVWFLNESVKWLESLPFSVLDGISLSAVDTLLLYVFIVVFLFYLSERKHKYLIAVFLIVAVLLIGQIIEQQKQFAQKKMVIYNIPKTTAIGFVDGKKTVLFTDSIFANDKKGLSFHIKPAWWEWGVEGKVVTADHKDDVLLIRDKFFWFRERTIYLLDKPCKLKGIRKLKIDYLLVAGNVKMNVEEMLRCFDSKTIVFNASNSEFRIKKWMVECEKKGQACYSTIDSGALVIDL